MTTGNWRPYGLSCRRMTVSSMTVYSHRLGSASRLAASKFDLCLVYDAAVAEGEKLELDRPVDRSFGCRIYERPLPSS